MYIISRLRSYYLPYEFVLLMKFVIFLRVEYSETSIDGRLSNMLFLCYPVLFYILFCHLQYAAVRSFDRQIVRNLSSVQSEHRLLKLKLFTKL